MYAYTRMHTHSSLTIFPAYHFCIFLTRIPATNAGLLPTVRVRLCAGCYLFRAAFAAVVDGGDHPQHRFEGHVHHLSAPPRRELGPDARLHDPEHLVAVVDVHRQRHLLAGAQRALVGRDREHRESKTVK